MSRYIDRDKLIDFIMESNPDWCVKPVRPIFDYINAMPTVDAVPVVRCKECKHSMQVNGMVGLVWCNHLAEVGTWVEKDFFCADGERRTE